MTTATLERARAYVDGELDAVEAAEFERECESDPTLAAEVEALEVSRLPYRAAMSPRHQPKIPASVHHAVTSAIEDARATDQVNGSAAQAARTKRKWSLAVAATFLAGLVTGPLVNGVLTSQTRDEGSEWAALVADYQSLYVPETIGGIDRPEARLRAEQLLKSINAKSGLPDRIPDLSAEGYEFVRAQHLGYQGEPLVQLVYADGDGNPLAVCYMPSDSDSVGADAIVEYTQGLGTIRWQEDGTRYVIVADETSERLETLHALSVERAG